jgi:hypothetical protein
MQYFCRCGKLEGLKEHGEKVLLVKPECFTATIAT